jgi:hypothetical protein
MRRYLLYKIVERQVKSWGPSDRIRIFGFQETHAGQNANCERSTLPLRSATPELLVILERSTHINSADLELCLQAANLRKR